MLFGSRLVDCRGIGAIVIRLPGTFGGRFGGGYRCMIIVNDAWLANTLAFDGLHRFVHVDIKLIAGFVAIDI